MYRREARPFIKTNVPRTNNVFICRYAFKKNDLSFRLKRPVILLKTLCRFDVLYFVTKMLQ